MAVDTSKWKKEDLDAIAAAGAAWNSATTQAEKDAAHAKAEAVRAKYGYTGGADGSNLQPVKTGGTTGNQNTGWTPADISGNNYAQMAGMSDLHQAALDAAGKSWQAAYAAGDQGAMDAAHAQAEAIRALYQYSGGADGSQYIPLQQIIEAPSYGGSDWDDVLNQAARELVSMNYDDWTKGDQYKALADRFGIQGRMSMQDVLGQISSRTGGLASSYATTAAQQQYNEYMSQLEEVARQMFAGERSDLLQNAQLAQGLADRDYNRYLDSLDQYYADRDFQYQAGRDQISDNRYNQQYADDNKANNKAEAQERVNAYLAAYGSVAELDPTLVSASGYTQSELATLEQYYADQRAQEQAAAAKKNTGGGSGSGGGTTQQKPTLTAAQVLKALESGVVNDTTKAAYEYYYGQAWDDAGAGEGEADATITNRHGDSWIYIPGKGRFSYQEVEKYVSSNQIIETYDPKTNSYTYAWNHDYK